MIRRAPVVAWSLASYLSLFLIGRVFEPIYLLWPHLFLLASQKLTGPPDDQSSIVALIVGIVPVAGLAWIRQRSIGYDQPEPFEAALPGLGLTVLTLGGLTLLAFIVAGLFGWPVGV